MKDHSRRRFLGATIGTMLGLAGLSAGNSLFGSEDNEGTMTIPDDFSLPKVTLGATGLQPTLLGIGTGTNGFGGRSRQTELGKQRLVSLLEYAHDRGVSYFDLADGYGSHPFMKEALTSGGGTVERDKAFLLTKTHARDARGMRQDLDRFRKELNTDYLDVVLLHCKFSGSWPEEHAGAMEVLSEAKDKGIIKAHGVSCHSFSALKTAAKTPWVDVDLARLNPWGRHMDSSIKDVKGVLQSMKDEEKGVIGMKILAQGEADGADGLRKAINYAMTSGVLDCFTIGVRNRTELDQLLATIAAEVKFSAPA